VSEADHVADGQDHSLDPRFVPLSRVAGGLVAGCLAIATLVGVVIALMTADDMPGWVQLLLQGAWLALLIVSSVVAFVLPRLQYRHTFYRVDAHGIEIRRGIYWRVVINVPRSRVQHIDVAHGPIDRRYGLGTLVLYTAGTDHAKVELEGLEHGRALRIREHLLPSGSDDAV
jgi:membrane protein YdbS with pleckstrin-like domain